LGVSSGHSRPAEFGANDAETQAHLKLLGKAMVSSPDSPKDGPDAEESGIPALRTESEAAQIDLRIIGVDWPTRNNFLETEL
jgi:hypothetical protein